MSNTVYPKFKEALGIKQVDLVNEAVGVLLASTNNYTPDFENDAFVSDIPESAILYQHATALTGTSFNLGIFDAANIVLSAITCEQCDLIILYQKTGSNATSRLIAYIDTCPLFPFDSNGYDVSITWANGTNKIFAL